MSTATHRTPRARSNSGRPKRTWLRLLTLESRINPTTFPDFVYPYSVPSVSVFPTSSSWGSAILEFQPFLPSDLSTQAPVAATPTIAEWTHIGQPNETLAIIGHQFSSHPVTEASKDTEFMVFGQTDSANGQTLAASTLRIDGPRAAVTLPTGDSKSPFPDDSMYLLWPGNAAGLGRPVRVNAPDLTWVGPNLASPKEQVTVYGTNLTRQGLTNQDTWIYLAPTNGTPLSNPWIHVATGEANPFRVTFELPADVVPEKEYHLWVHNGQGDRFGWSDPMTVSIRAPLPGFPTESSKPGFFDVTSYSATGSNSSDDDFEEIRQAIDAATDFVGKNPNLGATVYFPAGAYDVSKSLSLYNHKNIRFLGQVNGSQPISIIRPRADTSGSTPVYPSTIFHTENLSSNLQFVNLELNDAGNLRDDGTIYPTLARLRAVDDLRIDNVTFIADGLYHRAIDAAATENSFPERITIKDCKFVMGDAVKFLGATQVAIDNCVFEGVYNVPTMIFAQTCAEVSVTNCQAYDHDPDPNPSVGQTKINGYARGRLLFAQGDANVNYYIAGNETFDFAPEPTLPVIPGVVDANSGEQILFEPGRGAVYYGKPESAGASWVQFGDLDTDYDNILGRVAITIIDGQGQGQRRRVTNIDTSTGNVELDEPWSVVPDAGSTLAIGPAQQDIVIYDNILDGKEEWLSPTLLATEANGGLHTASSGVQIGGVAHVVVMNNTITNVRYGVDMIPHQRDDNIGSVTDPRPQFDTNYFNYVAGNTITNAVHGIAVATTPDVNASGYATVGYGAAHLGSTLRNNTFAEMKKIFYQNRKSFVIGTQSDFHYRSVDLTIIEDNKYPIHSDPNHTEDNGLVGIDLYGGTKNSFNTIIRKNIFTGLSSKATGVNFAGEGTPALFDNDWGNAKDYDGAKQPGDLLELPQRVVRLTWDGLTQTMGGDSPFVAVRNAGADTKVFVPHDFWTFSDSEWLLTSGINFPSYESGNESLYVGLDSEKIALLGDGYYLGTVTVTDGEVAHYVTVEVKTMNNSGGNLLGMGPFDGHLPNVAHDRVTTIEAEHYDRGGNNFGFYDSLGDDHVEPAGTGLAIVVPLFADWYDYTVNVPADGWFRVEARSRGAAAANFFVLHYGSENVIFEPGVSDWHNVRPTDGAAEVFVYLSYGLQTMRLEIREEGADIDWLRFMPVDGTTQVGIPVPFDANVPTVSHFAAVTINTERYDNGGAGVAYNDETSGNDQSSYREAEDVDATTFGGSGNLHAVVGAAGEWTNYAIEVAQRGTYAVQFSLKNSASGGKIRLQTPDGVTLFSNTSLPDVDVPESTGYTTVSRLVSLDSVGPKTIQLKFHENAGNDLAGEVQLMTFLPVNLCLHGPEAPAKPYATPAKVNETQVGTVFAVNTPGEISALRFFVNHDEYLENVDHTVRFWRVASSTVVNPVTGEVALTADTGFTGASVIVSANQLPDTEWKTVTLSSPLAVEPGLYVVSVNVAASLSISPITTYTHPTLGLIPGVAPPATPSVLTLVAGSISDTPNTFPSKVRSSPHPTVYYWLDVSFTPDY